jgi:cell wall-associated NlpC family hydrolase
MRSLFGTIAAAVAGIVMMLGGVGTANAAPSPADLEAQIDQQWNALEPVIEKHNAVKADLAANKVKAQQLADQIRPLQLKVDVALGRVSELSARYYMSGRTGTFNALLTSKSPTSFADQLSLLNALARDEQNQIKDVVTLKAQYDEAKKPLDALVAQLSAQETELAQQETTINAQIKQLNNLRLQAYGTTGGTGSLRPAACPYTYAGGAAAKAAQAACSQIGKPYVFGADGPGSYDCSGLTMYAWGQAGYKLRHYTQWQYQDTKRVSRADLRPGDLIFFYSDLHHVAMYVGGNWIVHAPHAGDVVRMKTLDGMPISGYGRVA